MSLHLTVTLLLQIQTHSQVVKVMRNGKDHTKSLVAEFTAVHAEKCSQVIEERFVGNGDNSPTNQVMAVSYDY